MSTTKNVDQLFREIDVALDGIDYYLTEEIDSAGAMSELCTVRTLLDELQHQIND